MVFQKISAKFTIGVFLKWKFLKNLWAVFTRIRANSTILHFSGKMQAREFPYSVLFKQWKIMRAQGCSPAQRLHKIGILSLSRIIEFEGKQKFSCAIFSLNRRYTIVRRNCKLFIINVYCLFPSNPYLFYLIINHWYFLFDLFHSLTEHKWIRNEG